MNAISQDVFDHGLLAAAVTFVEEVVQSLVDKPGLVEIHADTEPHRIHVIVTVDQDDLRYVIGKSGRTARSLRTILNAFGKKSGFYISLDIRQRSD